MENIARISANNDSEIGKLIEFTLIVDRGNSKIEKLSSILTLFIYVGQLLIPYLLCLIGKILESYLKSRLLRISKAHNVSSTIEKSGAR